MAPAGEVSKVMVDIYERGHQRLPGRVVVFEKIDRYSPNPEKLFMRFDTLRAQVITGFRVPTAGYSTWHIVYVDWRSARLMYNHTIGISSYDFVVAFVTKIAYNLNKRLYYLLFIYFYTLNSTSHR